MAVLAKTYTCGLDGVNGFPVEVEAYISGGMVGFEIVGLPSAAVKESRDRIRAAVSVSRLPFPGGKVTVNLAPADVRKEGTAFELAIAMALLSAKLPDAFRELDATIFLGELSLQGRLMPVRGALGMAITAAEHGFRNLILPEENALEVACIDGLRIYPAGTLRQVFGHMTGEKPLTLQPKMDFNELQRAAVIRNDLKYVKGQPVARQALEVAAAGGHNLLMVGIPGSGKTMLARCLPGILPPMTYEEALETTLIHSAAGELPEFQRPTLEALRQPLEDGFVTITRVSGQSRYLSGCMLVAGMNPCPCGFFGSKKKPCTCSAAEIKRYLGKISGPLLDRIDMQIEMDAVSVEEIENAQEQEDSATVRARVLKARQLQQERYRELKIFCNAQLHQEGLERYCRMTKEAKQLLLSAVDRFSISMRAYGRIQKVARTIADLAGHEQIEISDVAKAIQFRNLEGRFWN